MKHKSDIFSGALVSTQSLLLQKMEEGRQRLAGHCGSAHLKAKVLSLRRQPTNQ